MKNILTINDVGRMIHFKNREIRTPVIIEATDKELLQLKINLRMLNIKNYSIKRKINESKINHINNQIIIEELDIIKPDIEEEDPKTILNKLMNNKEL